MLVTCRVCSPACKEMGLIFLDRSANGRSKLMHPEAGLCRGEEVPRVQSVISQEFEKAAVELIGAGSCG